MRYAPIDICRDRAVLLLLIQAACLFEEAAAKAAALAPVYM
jgi:hypothetical protein